MIQPTETRTEINLLWLYTNPQLQHRSIDRLFEEYGNTGEYSIYTGRDGFVTLIAKRLKDDGRACMTEVIKSKRNLFAMMMTCMDCFVEDYRSGNTWVMEQHDKTREQNLQLCEVA